MSQGTDITLAIFPYKTMPTGYTDWIDDETTFEGFALYCSRQFGLGSYERWQPGETEIPEEFFASNYHRDELYNAKKELGSLLNMKSEEIEAAYEKDKNARLKRETEENAKRKKVHKNYLRILQKVEEWLPPTEDHILLKDFMIQQLTDSIRWDCSEYKEPIYESSKEWHEHELESCRWGIEHHRKHYEEEVGNAAALSDWVKVLRESFSK